MDNRFKERLLKSLLVLEVILLIILFPGMILISYITPNQEIFNTVFYTVLGSVVFVGILFILLWPMLGGIKLKLVQAERVALPFCDFISLKAFLNSSLKINGYKKQFETFCEDNNIVLVMYMKKRWVKVLDCFVIIRVDELSNSNVETINNYISSFLNEYYDEKKITDTINMISLFCVNRITPTFKKLVNSNIHQGFKNGRLPVGISFGGRYVYIAKQKDGFAVAKYKRMRKEFMDIMFSNTAQSSQKNTGDGSVCSDKK